MDSHDEDTPQAYDPDSDRDRQTRRVPPLDESSTTHRVDRPVGSRRPTAEKSPSTGFGSLARTYRDVAPYLGLGIQLAATIVVCFFIGRWLDQVLNTAPWLMIVGAFVGAAGGLYSFLKTVIELGKRQKEKQSRERSTRA